MALIHEKMAAINQEIGALAKDRRNSQQNFNFRGIDDVYNHVHGILAKHGVFVGHRVRNYSQSLADRVDNQGRPRSPERLVTMEIEFVFTAEDGTEWRTEMPAEGQDFADKATNKAISFAAKYAFINVFTIPTEMIDGDAESDEPDDGGQHVSQAEINRHNEAMERDPSGEWERAAKRSVLAAAGDKNLARKIWEELEENERLPAEGEWTRSKHARVVKEGEALAFTYKNGTDEEEEPSGYEG